MVHMRNQLVLLTCDGDRVPGESGVTRDRQRPSRREIARRQRAHVGASAARAALRDAVGRAEAREQARRTEREAALLAALDRRHPTEGARGPGREVA